MVVDAAVEQVRVAAFGKVEQLVAAESDLRTIDQGREEAKFAAGQCCCHAVRTDQFALSGVEHPFAEANTLGRRRLLAGRQGLGSSEDRRDARDQFARAEGLGDIIVGAHFEPDNAVHLLAAGRQQDYRYLRTFANRAA
jgi:hypothetical protein